jgi:hypothetical protein
MKWKLDTDRVVAGGAMIVSVGSLVVLAYTAYLTRQAQHASVLPYLYVALSSNPQGAHLLLENTGIGPAMIDEIRIHYDGRDIITDPYDFYLSLHPDRKDLDVDRVVPEKR